MKTLLQIKSSIFGNAGASSQLADHFVAQWAQRNPDGRVVVRDLGAEPIEQLDADRIQALATPAEQRTPQQAAIVAEADALIAELRDADEVAIGVPMYNFAIPTQLKAYFDHVARAQVTFRYTADGPQGLLRDRPTWVFATRGGFYRDTPADTQTPFLRSFLGLLGIRDVRFVYAEGLNISPENKAAALSEARETIDRLAA